MTGGGIELGAVLAGRYRIDRVLGQGGMGIVVQAMHLQLHQPVAMKPNKHTRPTAATPQPGRPADQPTGDDILDTRK